MGKFCYYAVVRSVETETLTGQALVNALIARDDVAWQAFVPDMGRMLRAICLKDDMSDDEIDDVAGAVVEKLLDRDCRILRAISVKDNNTFFGWLRIVIARTALDRVRGKRMKQGKEIKWAEERVEKSKHMPRETDAIELRVIIENAASNLTPVDQTLLWLKYWDTSDSEMARVTGLSLQAVEQRMSRLRKKIREAVPDRRGIFQE
jgi:RNA polymerase sigma factor (sigma-70 family)